MMKTARSFIGLFVIGLVAFAGAAQASGLPDENNIVLLDVTGDDNVLYIAQDYVAPVGSPANRISVKIEGDRNGGQNGWESRLPSRLGLEPGSLIQSGWGHRLDLTVTGSDNVFAVRQVGMSNAVTGVITGFGNQAAIQQTGSGNNVSFSQTGQSNTIVVSQTSH